MTRVDVLNRINACHKLHFEKSFNEKCATSGLALEINRSLPWGTVRKWMQNKRHGRYYQGRKKF